MDASREVADEDIRVDAISRAEDLVLAAEARPGKRARTRRCEYWIMLDGFLCPFVDDAGRTLTESTTSKGEQIIVGFSAVKPPKTSRLFYSLQLHQERACSSSSGDDSGSWISAAKAVAADGGCILLRFLIIDVPAEEEYDPETGVFVHDRELREELFVYQASHLTLRRLPGCGHDHIYTGVRNNIGIVCYSDDEFAVAHLTVTPNRCPGQSDCLLTADLCCMSSKVGQWRTIKSVPISNAEGQDHLRWWVTDTVITFDQCIYWVDYLRGALFCDVSSPCLQLCYVPLPVDPYWGDIDMQSDSRWGLSAYRSLCVTEDGNALKFVDVASSTCWFLGSQQRSCWFLGSQQRHPYCAVRTWRMTRASYSFKWVEDSCLEEKDFTALTKQHDLPFAPLKYPLVDRKNPQLIYFALEEDTGFNGKGYLITIDMRSKVLADVTPYTFGSFDPSNSDVCKSTLSFNLFNYEAFLPCEFSEHLIDQDEPRARDREDVGGLIEASTLHI